MSNSAIWTLIISLGALTFLFRASFIVFLGNKEMPQNIQRYLRYVAVALIPGMIAQQIAYPASLGGKVDIIWVIAALTAILASLRSKNALIIMAVGASTFIILMAMRSYGILF